MPRRQETLDFQLGYWTSICALNQENPLFSMAPAAQHYYECKIKKPGYKLRLDIYKRPFDIKKYCGDVTVSVDTPDQDFEAICKKISELDFQCDVTPFDNTKRIVLAETFDVYETSEEGRKTAMKWQKETAEKLRVELGL